MASGVLLATGFDWWPDGTWVNAASFGWTGGGFQFVGAAQRNGASGKGAANYDTGRPYVITPTTDQVVLQFAMKPSTHTGIHGICTFLANATATDWQLTIWRLADGSIAAYRGATNLGQTAAGLLMPGGVWIYLEVRVLFDASAGEVEILLNGEQVLLIEGVDTQDTAYDDCTGMMFRMDVGNSVYLDDIVFRDWDAQPSFFGYLAVRSYMPAEDGDSSDFTGSDADKVDNYLLVDETVSDEDTTYVASATPGDQDTYTIQDHGIVTGQVLAVQVHHSARKTDGATRQFAPVLRHGSDETVGATRTLSTGYATYTESFDDCPGSTGWTLAQLAALKVGQVVIA